MFRFRISKLFGVTSIRVLVGWFDFWLAPWWHEWAVSSTWLSNYEVCLEFSAPGITCCIRIPRWLFDWHWAVQAARAAAEE